MENSKVYQWVIGQDNRKKILKAIALPLTATQLATRTGIPVDTCSYIITKCVANGLLACLNPDSRKSRLYWLTELGIRYQKQLHTDLGLEYKEYHLPDIDWHLYGWLNFNHRSAIMKILTKSMQPSEIKRALRIHRPNIKISANNIRDIIKLLLARNIVRPIIMRKKAHPQYELTDIGLNLRQLLMQADSFL